MLFFDRLTIIKQQRFYCDFIDVRLARACEQTMLVTQIARLCLARRLSCPDVFVAGECQRLLPNPFCLRLGFRP